MQSAGGTLTECSVMSFELCVTADFGSRDFTCSMIGRVSSKPPSVLPFTEPPRAAIARPPVAAAGVVGEGENKVSKAVFTSLPLPPLRSPPSPPPSPLCALSSFVLTRDSGKLLWQSDVGRALSPRVGEGSQTEVLRTALAGPLRLGPDGGGRGRDVLCGGYRPVFSVSVFLLHVM